MKKPVLVYTDDGRDVDDIEAITYLQGSTNSYIAGIVTTHMMPDRRAMIARAIMNSFNEPDIPIGVGSIFPLGKEDDLLVKYLREHTIENRTYEGEGMIECFPDSIGLMHELIDRYGSKLSIAVLAPMTDLAKAVQQDRNNFSKVGRLYIQGQAKVEGKKLVPDESAYNLKEDMEAASIVFSLQDKVAMTFLGKYAAYQTPLLREDFYTFERTGHPVGKYLRIHAEKGLECFVKRAPDVFKKVFGIPADEDAYEAFKKLDKLSNPYDALTVMALAKPGLFSGVKIGKHKLIGVSSENHGLKDSEKVKSDLIQTMLSALKKQTNFL